MKTLKLCEDIAVVCIYGLDWRLVGTYRVLYYAE